MLMSICIFLAVVVVLLWNQAQHSAAMYEREWKEHLKTHGEVGRLSSEIESLRIKHNDWD